MNTMFRKNTSARLAPRTLGRRLALAFTVIAGMLAMPAAAQININEADATELQELNGIGPKLSEEIVLDREANGKFTSVEDLSRVRGVSSRLVEKIMDDITTGSSSSIKLQAGQKIPKKVVRKVLAAFDDEPSIREVQRAAIKYARAEPDTCLLYPSPSPPARTRTRMPSSA